MRIRNNPLSIFLLVTLLLFIIGTQFNAEETTNDIVESTCNKTPDPQTCKSALRSDPRSSTASDIKTLILIMIDIVKSRFSDSLKIAEDLTKKTHDPDIIRGLKSCIETYKVVIDANVKTAKTAVIEGDPKFGEEAMEDSGGQAEDCKSGFPDGKVPKELANRTPMLYGISIIAASLIKTME